jgi:c-di-GMP-binding flagellar brake protein YcgR
MDERRKFKRISAGSIVWYEIEDFTRMQAGADQGDVKLGLPLESVDISIGGIQIKTDGPLEAEKRLKLILSISPTTPPISILSRVVWARPAQDRKGFYLGLEFLEFLNGRKKLLEDHIYSHPG